MNYEHINEVILNARGSMATLRPMLKEMDPDEKIVKTEIREKLKVCMRKMDTCWTVIPEITERDHQMDQYFDKIDEIDAARKFGESLENEARFTVFSKHFDELSSQIHHLLAEADPDVYDDYRIAAIEEAEYARYEF